MCENRNLAELQVSSLNLAEGSALDRWRKGITILLEKELGNCYVEKLRAICLLEADFNWLLKHIFARCMTARI